MRWINDIKQKFISGFTDDIVCHFSDGDIYRNCSTGATVSVQPGNEMWIRFTAVIGAVSNSTIGVASQRLKTEPASVIISIFVPRTNTFSAAISLVESLDTAMMFDDFFTDAGGCVQLNTEEPKQQDTIYGDDGDIWNQINITYQYTHRYI